SVIETPIPQPKVFVIFSSIWLTNIILPHPIPSFLLICIKLFERGNYGIYKFRSFFTISIVVLNKEINRILATKIGQRLIVEKEQIIAVSCNFGSIRNIYNVAG